MRTVRSLLLLALLFFLITCNEKEEEARDVEEDLSTVLSAMVNAIENIDKNKKKYPKRIARGDTVAMHYNDLKKYLPKNISGYSIKGEPTRGLYDTLLEGMSYSICEQTFANDEGKKFKITLVDYNGAYPVYQGMLASMSIEIDKEKMQSIELYNEDIKYWELLKKKEKRASVFFGISDRFLLAIEAEGQDNTELVKSIAENLDLEELSKL